MKTFTFDDDGEFATGIPARHGIGWHVLGIDPAADLGGGTLRVYGRIKDADGATVCDIPVPDSKISAATVDENSDQVLMIEFRTLGEIVVKLSHASSPNVPVHVE